jgi:murein tripeptide amidase MpaA
MLNPDGVVMGNYRLSYSGSDLNRKWRDTSSKLHPEVYALKKYIQRLNK